MATFAGLFLVPGFDNAILAADTALDTRALGHIRTDNDIYRRLRC